MKKIIIFIIISISIIEMSVCQKINADVIRFPSDFSFYNKINDDIYFVITEGRDIVRYEQNGSTDTVSYEQIVITTDTIFYISGSGNDIIGDGTSLNPYLTVSRALDDLIGTKLSNADLYFYFDNAFTYDFSETVKTKLASIDYSETELFFIGESELVEASISFTETKSNSCLYNSVKSGLTVTENQYRGMFLDDGIRCYPVSYNSAGTGSFQTEYMRGARSGTRNIVGTTAILDFTSSPDDQFLEFNFTGITKITYERIGLQRTGDRIEFTTLDVFIDFTFGTKFICNDVILGQFSEHSAPVINFTGCYFDLTTTDIGVSTRNASGVYNFTRSVISNPNNTTTFSLDVAKGSDCELREVAIVNNGGVGIHSARYGSVYLSKTNIIRGASALFECNYGGGRIISNEDQGSNDIYAYNASYIVNYLTNESTIDVKGVSDETSTFIDYINPASPLKLYEPELGVRVTINDSTPNAEILHTKVLIVNNDTIKPISITGNSGDILINNAGELGVIQDLSTGKEFYYDGNEFHFGNWNGAGDDYFYWTPGNLDIGHYPGIAFWNLYIDEGDTRLSTYNSSGYGGEFRVNDGAGYTKMGHTSTTGVHELLLFQDGLRLDNYNSAAWNSEYIPNIGYVGNMIYDSISSFDITPAGSTYQVQYNNNGSLGASSRLAWNDTALTLYNSNNSVLIGFQAGLNKKLNESNNVFLGYQAGKGSGTELATENIAIGHIAGLALDNGSFNTFIGKSAGENTTNGFNNTFLGKDAGQDNVTGDDNTFIGEGAGEFSTGSENTFVGRNAGNNSTTNGQNTYIGVQSGYINSGFYNTYIGYDTRSTISTNQSDCVFIGHSAGKFTTASNYFELRNRINTLMTGDFSNLWIKTEVTHIKKQANIADNDATPSVTGVNTLIYQGSSNSVVITDLDNPQIGAEYMIIGNSDTYTISINDSGNFNLSSNWVGGEDDVIILRCMADNDYIEIGRVDN